MKDLGSNKALDSMLELSDFMAHIGGDKDPLKICCMVNSSDRSCSRQNVLFMKDHNYYRVEFNSPVMGHAGYSTNYQVFNFDKASGTLEITDDDRPGVWIRVTKD